ncbi:uncharacterized protein PGTG_16368 [Puccinia graminis f. sp. tritici CRL 75-36-700-3]|uniref:Uncharacterized protein n=1 Tax=Puccinia graminis f. sp. tritici (strain CRL 75-36-700-3 / race SCCL) TaxID=418459 RepID=E3L3Q2_PUCGT|nr:uncharacterized protein PGTG_16368 [Puccinia graminis f. sp. tritici CRL 75-36-700-3]EFP91177.1 hypothetical protein PGTG_16368 [Puccinia graminis f. sp. tritici CRL 75-36-700-3]
MTSALQDDQIKAMQTTTNFRRRTGTKYSTPETRIVLPPSSAKNFSYISILLFETLKIKRSPQPTSPDHYPSYLYFASALQLLPLVTEAEVFPYRLKIYSTRI